MGRRLRALRRRLLTPDVAECSLARRGFVRKDADAQRALETVGAMFLRGYAHAVESADMAEARARLAEVPDPWRGFAYEGAGMGAAVLDGLAPRRVSRVARLLEGEGDRHVYLVYVGIGWAMARLPRLRWPAPDRLDPLLRGLVLDGWGFHQAYFHTHRYVHEQAPPPSLRWPGDATAAFNRHPIDQGIGRALWFVGGTDVQRVAGLVERFAPQRRADLWAGVGLAATYAGAADAGELTALCTLAGRHAPQLAQASAFAADARVRAGLVQPHTGVATAVFCGTTPAAATALSHSLRPRTADNTSVPAYESWRRALIDHFTDQFAVTGGVRS